MTDLPKIHQAAWPEPLLSPSIPGGSDAVTKCPI